MLFSDYLYYLLHRIFKRRLREGSDADKLTQALGPNYDQLQEAIFLMREQANILTATGKALEQLGKDRGLIRYRDESEEAYRLRLLAAYSLYSQVGTPSAMLAAFERLGFTDAEIQEMRQEDPLRWAEFRVVLGLPAASFTEPERAALVATIRQMKPAHTLLDGLNIEVPAEDLSGAGEDITTWAEDVSWNLFACPLPAEELYPAEDLYPC